MKTKLILALAIVISLPANIALADETAQASSPAAEQKPAANDAGELAKKLSNPVADLISVPFQSNFEWGGGPGNDGFRYTLNSQPVIPVSISKNLNVVVRTIVPVIQQDDMIGHTSQGGLGDITQSFFLSPKNPGWHDWVSGIGPVFLYPSATDELLGSGKVGAGPTVVLLKQERGWTYGILANQIWSFAGEGSRPDVSAMFLQPFITFTTKKHTTFSLNTESTYDWENEQWTTPLNLDIAQLVKIGKLPVQFQIGGKYYAARPDTAPQWGIRFVVTLLFPKK